MNLARKIVIWSIPFIIGCANVKQTTYLEDKVSPDVVQDVSDFGGRVFDIMSRYHGGADKIIKLDVDGDGVEDFCLVAKDGTMYATHSRDVIKTTNWYKVKK